MAERTPRLRRMGIERRPEVRLGVVQSHPTMRITQLESHLLRIPLARPITSPASTERGPRLDRIFMLVVYVDTDAGPRGLWFGHGLAVDEPGGDHRSVADVCRTRLDGHQAQSRRLRSGSGRRAIDPRARSLWRGPLARRRCQPAL